MAWLYLLSTLLPRSLICFFVLSFLPTFYWLTWSLCYSLFCSSHALVYTHSCTSSCIINSWLSLCVSLFVSIGSIKEFGQVLTLLFNPEPRTRILKFTIISTIVTIMGLLYIILSLLLVNSIIIWFPCCCYCGLTFLKCVWRFYCIVGQLIFLMYSK